MENKKWGRCARDIVGNATGYLISIEARGEKYDTSKSENGYA